MWSREEIRLTEEPQTEAQAADVALLKELFTCYTLGDADGIRQRAQPDAVFRLPGVRPEIPWAGTFVGDEFAEAIDRVIDAVDILEFVAHAYEAVGDKVLVYAHETLRSKQTGKTCVNELVGIAIVTDGKLSYYREYADTAAMAAIFRP